MGREAAELTAERLVERYYAALNRRDVEAVIALFAPDAEYVPFNVGFVEGGSYSGHAGIRAFFAEAAATWEFLRAQPHTHRVAGDVIVVVGHLSARGRHSGIDVDSPAGWLFTLRDGKVSTMRVYLDPQQALQAAGLSD